MQADEISPIERDDRASLHSGIFEHNIVRDPLVCLACLLRRQHVTTQMTQFFDDAPREVLVGIESHHALQASAFSRIAWSISSEFFS